MEWSDFWFGFISATAGWCLLAFVGLILVGIRGMRRNQTAAAAILRGAAMGNGISKNKPAPDTVSSLRH